MDFLLIFFSLLFLSVIAKILFPEEIYCSYLPCAKWLTDTIFYFLFLSSFTKIWVGRMLWAKWMEFDVIEILCHKHDRQNICQSVVVPYFTSFPHTQFIHRKFNYYSLISFKLQIFVFSLSMPCGNKIRKINDERKKKIVCDINIIWNIFFFLVHMHLLAKYRVWHEAPYKKK